MLITAIALAAGAVTAWRWYSHQPMPVLASFSVLQPGRTRLEEDAKPLPLIVHFDRSAATLASPTAAAPRNGDVEVVPLATFAAPYRAASNLDETKALACSNSGLMRRIMSGSSPDRTCGPVPAR